MTSLRLVVLAVLLFIYLAHTAPLEDKPLKSRPDDLRVNRERRDVHLFRTLSKIFHDMRRTQDAEEDMVVASLGLLSPNAPTADTNGTSARHRRSAQSPGAEAN